MVKSWEKINSEGYKLIAFDLDGTLIRGRSFRFSWESIWKYLKYDDSIRVQFFNDYLNQKISYEKWCEICTEHYIEKRLNRTDLNKISSRLHPTKNLDSTIRILRKNGLKTAVISGGIDTFLEDIIPNYGELFDYVFINKFHFDEQDFLSAVEPTKYDFEGKIEALKKISNKEKITLNQCVFVGEEKNDSYVFEHFDKNNIGLGIAYPPTNSDVEHRAHYKVKTDNLELILKYIIGRNKR